jgi:hypothetical protein
MLISYATYRRPKASIYRSPVAAGGGGQRQSPTTNCIIPTHRMGILWYPRGGSFKSEVASVKSERSAIPPSDFRLPHGKSCETNPISPRHRRLPEEIVQNEAKLGWNGVCGQTSLPCGAWLGRGVKRAKRTQFLSRPQDVGRGRPTYEEPNRAKRTQFRLGLWPMKVEWASWQRAIRCKGGAVCVGC